MDKFNKKCFKIRILASILISFHEIDVFEWIYLYKVTINDLFLIVDCKDN